MNLLLKKTLRLALLAAAPAVCAETPKAVPAPPPHSVFIMPASPRDGRDPFFPDSSRPYEDVAAAKHSVDTTALSVKGLSIEGGRAMVIINNHTFAVGDEGNVQTAGGRVHIRFVELRNNVITIEVNGSRRDLTVGTK